MFGILFLPSNQVPVQQQRIISSTRTNITLKQLHKQHINIRKKKFYRNENFEKFLKIYIFLRGTKLISVSGLECIFPEQARQIFPPLQLTHYSITIYIVYLI